MKIRRSKGPCEARHSLALRTTKTRRFAAAISHRCFCSRRFGSDAVLWTQGSHDGFISRKQRCRLRLTCAVWLPAVLGTPFPCHNNLNIMQFLILDRASIMPRISQRPLLPVPSPSPGVLKSCSRHLAYPASAQIHLVDSCSDKSDAWAASLTAYLKSDSPTSQMTCSCKVALNICWPSPTRPYLAEEMAGFGLVLVPCRARHGGSGPQ